MNLCPPSNKVCLIVEEITTKHTAIYASILVDMGQCGRLDIRAIITKHHLIFIGFSEQVFPEYFLLIESFVRGHQATACGTIQHITQFCE